MDLRDHSLGGDPRIPVDNIYQIVGVFVVDEYLSQTPQCIDTLRSAHYAVHVRTIIEEVTTCLLYSNSFSLSSVASSIASNINFIWILSFCLMA